jgi:ammonia channel protein AmtB
MFFDFYKKYTRRDFTASNISFQVAGTLIVLVCSLFMNAGSKMDISEQKINEFMANQIVMNIIISASSSGLYVVF